MTLAGIGWTVENAARHVRDEGTSNLKSLADLYGVSELLGGR